ncbi:F-box/kelch-repeat protein At3g06240-like [Abrus precatorius]|uniref:F-box/kelch-repeat protein At3g06240-like n=1 Tax=Abrus precatorius TaxID=3816 RepID=A0A8B8L6B3_ABRPR|nr:F-box/kelch-repeat protein At3g06240-like [Abrus precatorius]
MENDRRKKNTFTLPHELIEEILLRLPVKSLLRFKSVCKSWLNLISDPQFAKSQFDLAAVKTHRLLLRSTNRSIKSLDIEASLRDDSSFLNLLLPPPPLSPFLFHGVHHEGVEILGTCRGLVLLLYRRGDIVLWNPSIGVHKRVSHSPFCGIVELFLQGFGHPVLYGFGYDASTEDYCIIFIATAINYQTVIEIFSMKANSWSSVKREGVASFPYELLGFEFRAGLHLNGAIHWLVLSEIKKERVIIGFDLMEKVLFEIPLPDELIPEPEFWLFPPMYGLCRPRLRVMRGCLALCYPGAWKGDEIEIWVMEQHRVASSWTKSIVVSTSRNIPHKSFFPLCFTKGGGMLGTKGRRKLVKLDDKGKVVEDFGFNGDFEALYTDNLHSAMYRESLLPLPVVD